MGPKVLIPGYTKSSYSRTFFWDAVAAGAAAASALYISLCTYMGALRAPVYVHSEIYKAEAAAEAAAELATNPPCTQPTLSVNPIAP